MNLEQLITELQEKNRREVKQEYLLIKELPNLNVGELYEVVKKKDGYSVWRKGIIDGKFGFCHLKEKQLVEDYCGNKDFFKPVPDIDQLITDTAHAVAKAVIGEAIKD